MDKDIQGRIKRVIDELCGENKSEFCRRIHRPNTAVKDIIGGKRTAPGYELIFDILSSDLGISPSWLILGDGPMLLADEEEQTKPQGKVVLNDIHDNPTVTINYLHDAIKDAIKEAYYEIKNTKK